jgi:selenocysteine-specific elongation factor
MIVGTAGHVDHGKTALVKALTGVDTDRLAEEKRRGITIDLGYAYTDEFGFVDVPGHERFVHTMLAGASGIDTALLVVSLPEGIRPQTREHLQILSLLGITAGVVALTKLDLAPDRVPEVSAALRDLLAGTPLAGAPAVPVSAFSGEGLDDLRDALRLSAAPARPAGGYPRLAVDRAFTLSGAGLVVTGTLVSGRIAVEDRLVLSPPGLELRVRGLRAHNQPATEAFAGQRVALNITGPKLSKEAVSRGDWVLHPFIHAPAAALDARISLLPGVPRALRQDTRVHLHLGAAHTMARVSLLDRDRLEPGDSAPARLTLAAPIGALALDRLVLRDTGAIATIGGGVVLDPFPPHRGRRTAVRLSQLRALEQPEALGALLATSPGWTDAATFLRARNVADPSALPVPAGGLFIAPPALETIRDTVAGALAQHHRAHPELPGLQPDRLRIALADRPPASAFAGILDALVHDGILAREGPWFRLPGHKAGLSPMDEKLWPQIEPRLSALRFRPPRVNELSAELKVPEPVLRASLKRLSRLGRTVEVVTDLYFLRTAVAEMAVIAAETKDESGHLTAALFRDRLDNGRKVAIHVLEFFDKAGITVRTGDLRRVRPEKIGLFGPPEGRSDRFGREAG